MTSSDRGGKNTGNLIEGTVERQFARVQRTSSENFARQKIHGRENSQREREIEMTPFGI